MAIYFEPIGQRIDQLSASEKERATSELLQAPEHRDPLYIQERVEEQQTFQRHHAMAEVRASIFELGTAGEGLREDWKKYLGAFERDLHFQRLHVDSLCALGREIARVDWSNCGVSAYNATREYSRILEETDKELKCTESRVVAGIEGLKPPGRLQQDLTNLLEAVAKEKELSQLGYLHQLRKVEYVIFNKPGVGRSVRPSPPANLLNAQVFPRCEGLWAVLIGIDDYDIPDKLSACVLDVQMMKSWLTESLHVDAKRIQILDSHDLTARDSIISTLWSLCENGNIQPDDPILIHFSGHGTSYDAREIFPGSYKSIEAILPSDRGTRVEGRIVLDIMDYELHSILDDLSKEKGNNITLTLDCCYSSGVSRNVSPLGEPDRLGPISGIRFSGPLKGYLKDMLHVMDEGRLKHNRPKAPKFEENWVRNKEAFVTLAACLDHEQAFDGYFTPALLSALRSLEPSKATYRQLSEKIPAIMKDVGMDVFKFQQQQPIAIGQNIDELIFRWDTEDGTI